MDAPSAPSRIRHDSRLARAARAGAPAFELLEKRQFFSISTVQPLPFFLDFNSDRGELLDKDGQGTGFTRVQENKLANQYQPALIDLDTAAGVLKLTSSGTSTAASNTNGDNTLVNALETQFNATTSGFKITVRLKGPLDYINSPSEQAGVMFGPDQDNFIKLVAISQPTGQFIQFGDETYNGSTWSHQVSLNTSVGSFASINFLDLQLVGDAAAGTISAYYAINGGSWVKLSKTVTLSSAIKGNFFNSAGRAGLIAVAKNDGPPETFIFDSFRIDAGQPINAKPSVIATRPANGDVAVARDAFVSADVKLLTPGAGIDPATLSSSTVKLYRASDKAAVATVLNLSSACDTVIATPISLLDANTTYTFEITAGLKDTAGSTFVPYTMSFTTGNSGGVSNPTLAFEKVNLPTATGNTYTCMAIGPDGRLYASTDQGLIQRFTINADSTLGAAENITSLIDAQGARWISGFAFDPQSNPSNMLLWVAHSDAAQDNAADFSGKITKIYGGSFEVVQDAVINLPRSIRGTSTNQVAFGPDGKLYFAQSSMTDMGAQDNATGLRTEHLLSGAILRLDTTAIGIGDSAIDAKTDSGGTYNPFAPGAPLTIYATGVKNAYDLVWTSDGHLYAPSSGATAGGNAPGTPSSPYSYGPDQRIDYAEKGPYTGLDVPAISNVLETQADYLFDIKEDGYYGQPNATRGEFVLNGGNPSSGIDANEVAAYPVGTFSDRNYRGSAYTFGKSFMPGGLIEYHGTAFGGALNGKLLVTRYGGGDDIVILSRNADGSIASAETGVAGLTGFVNPLDIIQSSSGFLYVAEQGKITLVKPIATGANIVVDKPKMYFNDQTPTGSSQPQKLTITNTGTSALVLPADGLTITGTDAARFTFASKPTLPATIAPGASVSLTIIFTANAVGIKSANLQIKSNDEDAPVLNLSLRGLGHSGYGGANEPSLQRVFDLYQLPINVGDSNPGDVYLDDPPVSPNDEIVASILRKAGTGPVTIEPLAIFGVGNSTTPTVRFGYYTPGNKNDKTEMLTLTGTGNLTQTVNPQMSGYTSFDPGAAAFGLYATFPSMYPSVYNVPGGTEAYSEDRLNEAYDPNSPRKVRYYQLKTADGSVVPNAYIFAFEDYLGGYDNQDLVGIIRNVTIAPAGPEIGFENLDNLSFTDRLVFSRIQVQPPDPKTDPITGEVTQPPNNVVHDIAVLRLRNTGTQSLNISSLTTSAGFAIDNAPTLPLSIPAGGSIDLTIRFNFNSTTTNPTSKWVTGALTIGSNDADEPTSTIQLSGFWQKKSENPEPTLQDLVNTFGYATKITNTGQVLNQGGAIARVGDEVLSAYWKRSDAGKPVTVRQLAAYHTQGNPAFIRYFTVSSTGTVTQTNLFTHDGLEGQSILPHLQGSLTSPAYATFNPTKEFGFRIDSEWSDPTKNAIPEGSTTDQGHHVRFWVARDRNGNIIPDTYLMAMDYAGINYDYNDNLYLVTNVKPLSPPSSPTGQNVTTSGAGTQLDWANNTEANLGGYNIYRSDAADGTFTKINSIMLSTSDFLDVTAPVGVTAYYRIVAVDNSGNESAPATIEAIRPTDTTPPATPSNIAATGSESGILLQWANNTDSDLAGYNIYRSDSFSGAYTLLNTEGLLTASQFLDTTAPLGVTSYYRVTAVDSSNNESAANVANAMRPAADTTPPAAPTGAVAMPSLENISLDWTNNTESDFAGYNVYRATSQFGTYVKLNAALLTSSDYVDNTATAGVKSWYHLTAVDNKGNESVATTVSATRIPDTTPPAVPSGLSATGSTSGIALDWNDNSEADFGWYNVYASDLINGTFIKVNATKLTASEYLHDAAQGVATYYQITAVDSSGNESAYAEISTIRPDSVPPAAPSSPSSTGSFSGVAVDWADSSESDLAGYNIYRSTAVDGIFAKLNDSLLSASEFADAGAPSGATSFYRITAVDVFGNESIDAAATSTFRPNLGLNGNMNDIVFDSTGVLHFAYYDAVTKNVKYASRSIDGVWSNVTTVDASGDDVGGWLSIAVDSQNRPAIAYFDGTAGDLRYAILTNGLWDVQTVDSKGSVGLFPSLKFDKNDHPAIAYYKKTTGDLRLAVHNGSNWVLQHIDGELEDVGRSASLALQSNGLWAIAYENCTGQRLQYAYQTSSTSWTKMTADTSSAGIGYISLAFDGAGRASISYQETGAGDLKYAVLKSGKFVTTTVAWKGAVGMYTRLLFTSDGLANIFYYSKQLNTLMHAKGYLGSWEITQLKDNGGRFISAAMSPSNKIAYAWLDSASDALTMDEL